MKRRSMDKFNPEPVPKNMAVYRERSWHTLQQIGFHVSEMNGTVQENKEKIALLDKDVTVSKRLAWVAVVILTLAMGLYAAFFPG